MKPPEARRFPWSLPLALPLLLPLAALLITGAGPAELEVTPARLLPLLLARTAAVGVTAAGCAVLIGLPAGWLLGSGLLRPRLPWLAALCLPLAAPPYVLFIGYSHLIEWLGAPAGLIGSTRPPDAPLGDLPLILICGAVLGTAYAPLILLGALQALDGTSAWQVEEYMAHRNPAAALWLAAAPALGPALAVAAAVVGLLAISDFGLTNAAGLTTLPVAIVNEYAAGYSAPAALRVALPAFLLALPLLLLLRQFVVRHPNAPHGQAQRLLLPAHPLARAAAGLVCLATWIVPVAALARASLPVETYRAVWQESADHFANTAALGGATAIIATALAALALWRLRPAPAIEPLLLAAYALPASLPAIGLAALLNRCGLPGAVIYDSPAVLLWIYVALALPPVVKLLQPAFLRIDQDQVDAARTAGAANLALYRAVLAPALSPALLTAFFLSAAVAAREMDATALLRVPGLDTISFRIHDYLHFGSGSQVAALSLLLLVPGLAALAAALLLQWRTRS